MSCLTLVTALLRRYVISGRIILLVGNDPPIDLCGRNPGPSVAIRFRDRRTFYSCALDPELRFGESYAEGTLTLERGTLTDFVHLARLNAANIQNSMALGVLRSLRAIPAFVLRTVAQSSRIKNVRHHYDIDDSLFEVMLDSERQYSCAYFDRDDLSLEQAQQLKMRRLASKLLLKPGLRVLDVGSGWGGLALHLARLHDVSVDGISLSDRQVSYANDRARTLGLADRVHFYTRDFAKNRDKYDRIVSVGMLEHVGRVRTKSYFSRLAASLTPSGVALIHSIGVFNSPGSVGPWMDRYIFPGAYLPSLSQVLKAVEHARLLTTDAEILRRHYALTLFHWRLRAERSKELLIGKFGRDFYRMWEFYLTACEALFRLGQAMVLQIQVSNDAGAVPFTRDYMTLSHDHADTPVAING